MTLSAGAEPGAEPGAERLSHSAMAGCSGAAGVRWMSLSTGRPGGRRRAAGGAGGGKPSPPQSAVGLRSRLSKATEVQVLSAPNGASVMPAEYPVGV